MEDSTHNTFPWLKSYIYRLVCELFEHFLKSGPAREQILEPDRTILQLRFETIMPDHFFVGKKVEGLDGAIRVKLINATTGDVVESESLSSLELDVVVLAGDFNDKGDNDWTSKDFDSKVKLRGKRNALLLKGDLRVTLKGGVGDLGEFSFTDISSRTESGKFRLGVKVASGSYKGIRVREAITVPFKVIHFKSKSHEKHVPRALDAEVCKLMGIGRAFHKNLEGAGIYKVKDFHRKLLLDPKALRQIVGSTISDEKWDALVHHAKKSVLSGGEYYSAETLSDSHKGSTLQKVARDDGKALKECFGPLSSEMKPSKRPRCSPTNVTGVPESCPSSVDSASLSYVGPQVNPVLDTGDPHVPFDQQVPSVPSEEADENSTPDFEDRHFASVPDNNTPDGTSLIDEENDRLFCSTPLENSGLCFGDPLVPFDQQAPVPDQPPSVTLDFEDNDFDLTSLLQDNLNPSLDALFREADEHIGSSIGGYGDSLEQGKQL